MGTHPTNQYKINYPLKTQIPQFLLSFVSKIMQFKTHILKILVLKPNIKMKLT